MKEFVEKLIGRLEEKFKYNSEQAEIWRNGSDKDAFFREKKDLYMDRANTYGEVMRIANQLAEEYNNGWISVSERLPNKEEYLKDDGRFIVTDGNRRYMTHFDIYETQKFGVPQLNGFCEDKCVVAWQPLPAPYQKGE